MPSYITQIEGKTRYHVHANVLGGIYMYSVIYKLCYIMMWLQY